MVFLMRGKVLECYRGAGNMLIRPKQRDARSGKSISGFPPRRDLRFWTWVQTNVRVSADLFNLAAASDAAVVSIGAPGRLVRRKRAHLARRRLANRRQYVLRL